MNGTAGVQAAVSNVARTILGAAAFVKNGRTPSFAYQSMLQLFCATGGASNDAMSSLLALVHRPYGLPDAGGVLGDFAAADIERIGADIRQNGYHVFQQRLPDSLCDELLSYATTAPCVRRGTDEGEKADLPVERFPRGNPDGVRYD